MNLDQAFTQAGPVGTPRFLAFMKFVIPSEIEFQQGHYGDYAFVRTEDVQGDDGGRTRYGIDQASHPRINIDTLSLKYALAIYYTQDWYGIGAENDPPGYGEFLADVHINGGNGPRMIQQALNTLPGISLHVDGFLGPMSQTAMIFAGEAGVKACLARRDEYYKYLAATVPHDRQFLAGWLNRDEALENWLQRNESLSVHLGLA